MYQMAVKKRQITLSPTFHIFTLGFIGTFTFADHFAKLKAISFDIYFRKELFN